MHQLQIHLINENLEGGGWSPEPNLGRWGRGGESRRLVSLMQLTCACIFSTMTDSSIYYSLCSIFYKLRLDRVGPNAVAAASRGQALQPLGKPARSHSRLCPAVVQPLFCSSRLNSTALVYPLHEPYYEAHVVFVDQAKVGIIFFIGIHAQSANAFPQLDIWSRP